MRSIGIVPHLVRRQAAVLARQLIDRFEREAMVVRIPASDAAAVDLGRWAVPDAEFGEGLDLACSLGGDGTMLRTIELVAAHDVPVLGVNVGHLGYLTAVLPEDLPDVLERAIEGRYELDERMTLSVEIVPVEGPPSRFLALNEAVLEKSSPGHTVRLGVSFNDVFFTNYSADGVIVATPTGSTAYAFSARGPIVSPRLAAIVVVPVSAHMLFDRSLVLDARETVQVQVLDSRGATLFLDGRASGPLSEGTIVRCSIGSHPARLVSFGRRDFHQILKAKFGLPGPEDDRRWNLPDNDEMADDSRPEDGGESRAR